MYNSYLLMIYLITFSAAHTTQPQMVGQLVTREWGNCIIISLEALKRTMRNLSQDN
jgi:hypothetical protein